MPDRLTDAVVDIATQLRRIADAHTTPNAAHLDAATTTPDDRPSLRQRIADALEAADYRPDMRRGDLADSVLPVVQAKLDQLQVAVISSDLAARRAMEQRQDMATERYALQERAETAEQRLKLAHQARRAKVAQLDDIKRAMLDTGLIAEGDPYSHADLADVIRHAITDAR